MEVKINSNLHNEEYLINRARSALKLEPLQAKAWMLTAKTLYPNNFTVQFEAYMIEKHERNPKEAAKCFSDLITKFQQQPEFWEEINNVTSALREENELNDAEKQFLCDMFQHIPLEIQHKLLILTADRCNDTKEHCTLLLLLLQRFPSAVTTHGPGLVETLLNSEKHSAIGSDPTNCYRKLLVCDLLPLLNTQNEASMDFSIKMIYKLLHKSVEYHLTLLRDQAFRRKECQSGFKVEESWTKLFKVVEFVGKQLGWESCLVTFSNNWNKEIYWQKLLQFYQSQNLSNEDPNIIKQLVYSITILLLYCLYQYINGLNADNVVGQMHPSYLLVEAFVDPNFPTPPSQACDHKAKRRKSDVDVQTPGTTITTEKATMKHLVGYFMMAVNCWDLLHSVEFLTREFVKLSGILELEQWLSGFLVDYLIYKGKNDDALKRLDNDSNQQPLVKNILKASVYFLQANYMVCYDYIIDILNMLPSNLGAISTELIIGRKQRHLHFLALTRLGILQYCAKLLLRAIRNNGLKSDMAIGHCFVLMQLDWPQEEDALPGLIQEICQARVFYYLLFQNYIVEVDILEQLAYLWNCQPGLQLEILPNVQTTRRIGTRGADKGMREEIKSIIRKQITQINTDIDVLIFNFITQERLHIAQALILNCN